MFSISILRGILLLVIQNRVSEKLFLHVGIKLLGVELENLYGLNQFRCHHQLL